MNLQSLRHYLRGRLFELLHRRDAALAEYRAALEFDSRSARLNHVVAVLLTERKRYADAEPYFQRVLALKPDDAGAWFNLGFLYDQSHEPARAVDAFGKAVQLNAKLDRAWYGMGLCHAALGNHADACQALQQAAELQPMNGFAWYHLGMAYHVLDMGDKVAETARHLNRFDRKLTRQLIDDTGRQDLRHLVADMIA